MTALQHRPIWADRCCPLNAACSEHTAEQIDWEVQELATLLLAKEFVDRGMLDEVVASSIRTLEGALEAATS